MIRVTVPATTANLGPGFDSLGCALSMYAHFECETIDSGLQIEGCEAQYCNESNLFVRAFRRTEREMGAHKMPIHLKVQTEVPTSRGLGSSATFIVGGILAANALHGNRLNREECLNIAVDMEGHPDNAAPALLGGLRASFMANGETVTAEVPMAENIGFIALIPNFETKTSDMRRVLPQEIARADAIFNISRVSVLLRAMETGDLNLIGKALEDRLHQPYREGLIYEYDRAKAAALNAGASAFCISGSGSTCLAIADCGNVAGMVNEIQHQLSDSPFEWKALALRVDARGAFAEEI